MRPVEAICAHPTCGRHGNRSGLCGTHYARVHVRGGELVRPRDFDTDDARWCAKCEERKPLSEFPINKGKPDSYCRPCRARYWLELRWARDYGLTPEQHAEMFQRQGGLCLGCREAAPLVVDHCHETGKVRGLLCDSCNKTLGTAQDDPEILRALATYLEASRA